MKFKLIFPNRKHRFLTWYNVDKRRSSSSFESRSPGAAEGSLSPFESWRIHSIKMGRTAALIPSTWTRPKILRIEHDNLPSLAVYALLWLSTFLVWNSVSRAGSRSRWKPPWLWVDRPHQWNCPDAIWLRSFRCKDLQLCRISVDTRRVLNARDWMVVTGRLID